MNNPAFFELQADDPERLAGFYTAVFEWRFEKQAGVPIDYWRITTPGMAGGLLKSAGPKPPEHSGTNAAVISIEIANYDVTDKAVLDNGGVVAVPKYAVPGRRWQGYYIDTDGNTFGIFEADESAK